MDIFYEFHIHFGPPIHHIKATIFLKTSKVFTLANMSGPIASRTCSQKARSRTRTHEASQRSIALIGSRTSELTVVANYDIFVLGTDESVSHDINEILEASFSGNEDDNITLSATSPIINASFFTPKIFRENRHDFIVYRSSSDRRIGVCFRQRRFMATFQAN